MTSPAQTTLKLRMLARLVLRVAWTTALVLALVSLAREGPAYLRESRSAAAGRVPTPVVLEELRWSIGFAASALWLLVLDFLLLSWLVRVPKRACPGCGYDLTSSNSDRCPECGLGSL